MTRFNISFAGAGRVAGALCREFHIAGHNILKVVSRTEMSGRALAESCNADWSDELSFRDSNDIIVVAVPDSGLKDVLAHIKCPSNTIIAHTAGSYGLEVFPDHLNRVGIFYPLQTFTIGRKVNFKDLPFLLESSSTSIDAILADLAGSVGGKVHFVNADKRRMFHLSAVFVSNFTNFMLTSGKNISSRAGLPFDILVPLIRETISRALESGPEDSQTGPAIRNDQNTIEKHLELLSFSPELQDIYRDLTQAIIKYYCKS
jgi:predicted short-subunit dehydrogenase-like oxidoreductase (DUF2520 family)